MRLWHKDLIPYLPRAQLVGQWRECCLIAKNIAEKCTPGHVLVNRVMNYPIEHFVTYTASILTEMINRGYHPEPDNFRRWMGDDCWEKCWRNVDDLFLCWHCDRYLRQCLANLQEKADCGAMTFAEWKRIADRWPEWR